MSHRGSASQPGLLRAVLLLAAAAGAAAALWPAPGANPAGASQEGPAGAGSRASGEEQSSEDEQRRAQLGVVGQGDEFRDPASHPAYYRAGPFLEGYEFTELPLDPGSLFYPSSATTRSGDYYSQEKLMAVERCGDAGCHPDIYGMWYESTHHLASFNDPWYRRTFQLFEERSGQETARWCAGCHDPAIMMTGRMRGVEPIDFESAGANVGITCQFCHSVGSIHPAHANGSYELAPSYPLPHEGADDPELRRQGNRELLASPEMITRHKADRRKPFHLFGEFCGTCHKQSLITPANNYKWLRGFDEFDDWQDSGVSGFSARSFYYPPEPMTCQDCHMPEVPSDDAGADDGYVNSHRFVGANTALSSFHGYPDQLRATADFLRDDQVSVDIFAVQHRLPNATGSGGAAEGGRPEGAGRPEGHGPSQLVAPADAFGVRIAPGQEVDLEVVVRTRGVGHLFPGGTTDSNLVWLELAVLDGEGEPLLASGYMDDDRFVDPMAHFYKGVFLDEAGQEIAKRNGWDRRAAVYVRTIPPGAADTVHYRLRAPEGVRGPLRVRARLAYRKHKQAYNLWAMGARPAAEQPEDAVSAPWVDTRAWEYDLAAVPELPTVVMAEDTLTLGLLDEGGGALWVDGVEDGEDRLGAAREHWERFNDWGIGLLRQEDFRGALRAFRVVQRARPDYADAWINEARVHLAEGGIERARVALEKAFELEPGFFKADYFMARVDATVGDYETAAARLERVRREFRYDRQVRLDLGRAYYRMGRYRDAIDHLLQALEIDPELRAAHYTLMRAYRALGEEEKAHIHETRFRRYREDEDIRALTRPFRQENPGVNLESQAIHVHELQPPRGRFSAAERFPLEVFLEGGEHRRPPTVFPGPAPPWLRDQGDAGGR